MRLLKLRVRGKLLLPIMTVVILSISGLVAFSYYEAKTILTEEIHNGIQVRADAATETLDVMMRDIRTNMLDWARSPVYALAIGGDEDAQAEVNRMLDFMVGDYDYYETLCVVRADGVIVASNNRKLVSVDITEREYFQKAVRGQVNFSKAIASKGTGQPVVVLAVPVKDRDGRVIGIMLGAFQLEYLTAELIDHIKIGETGYALISDPDGLTLAHPNRDFIMKLDASEFDFGKQMLATERGIVTFWFDPQQVWKTQAIARSKETGWIVAVSVEMDELLGPLNTVRDLSVLGGIVALLALAGVVLFVVRRITRVLGRGVEDLNTFATGDLSRDIPERYLSMDDEFGDLARATGNLISSQREKARLAEAIAAGDLTLHAEPTSDEDQLGHALKRMGEALNSTVSTISEAAQQVAAGSGQVSASSQSLSQGATEQAASLEEITASVTEIGSQTKSNAESASQANQMMAHAQKTVLDGKTAGEEITRAMSGISEASEQVGKIIKVIDEIAFQTNLLALNAAVEAARAGRHGKGFAVVAEEVRNLAGRSAKAAKETAELIENAIDRVNKGMALTDRLDEGFKEIATASGQIGDLIAEIAAASSEQAEGVSQVSEGLTQVDQVTHQNTANAEETASAATELSSQAAELRRAVSQFKLRNGTGQVSVVRREMVVQAEPLPGATPVDKGDGEWGGVGAQPRAESVAAGVAPRPEDVISLDEGDFERY